MDAALDEALDRMLATETDPDRAIARYGDLFVQFGLPRPDIATIRECITARLGGDVRIGNDESTLAREWFA